MSLTVEIAHRFPAATLAVAFEAPVPGVIALFGPSGSGKTTVLNAVAGLLRPRLLSVTMSGLALHNLPPEQRRIGYVFQDGRLFPHMSVRDNLHYGWLRAPPGPVDRDEVIALLGLGRLLPRMPHTLSGGERQRVAIGRALLRQPRLLLMDEPLSGLDSDRKDEILPYLARLRGAFGVPILYATHAYDEVIRLADTLVLLRGGSVLAAGPMASLVARPDLPLAARDDAAGILLGKVQAHDTGRRLSAIACGANVFLVPMVAALEGTDVRLRVPARDVVLALSEPQAISISNIVAAEIVAIHTLDVAHAALVELSLDGGGELLSRVTLDAVARLGLRVGGRVLALVKAMSPELYRG